MSAAGFDTCNPDSRFSGIQHLTSGLASIFRHTLKIIKELNDHDLRIYEDFTYVPYHEIINIFTFERIYIFYYKCLSRQLQSSPPLVVFYYSISLMVKIIKRTNSGYMMTTYLTSLWRSGALLPVIFH